MPFNVLIGYVYIDSFARSTSEVSLTSFLDNLTYSDTSRKALSYLYQMDDFDPIRYFQYGISVPTSAHYQTIPVQLMHKFGRFLSKVFPDSGHAAALYYPDYMLDILVTDTVSKGDSLAAISKSCVGVSAVVLDTIKGRVLPPFSTSYVNKSQNIQPQTSLPMIGFDYRPDRIRVSRAGNYYAKGFITIAADHSPWIKKSREYIVFLLLSDLHTGDNLNNYSELIPSYAYSTCASMYPVVDGIVYDPNNDFGFGSGLTKEAFKSALRSRIANIVSAH